MSRYITKEQLASCLGSIRKNVTKQQILNYCLQETAVAQNDSEVSGSVEDAQYYAGRADALAEVIQMLGRLENVDEFCDLLGYTDAFKEALRKRVA